MHRNRYLVLRWKARMREEFGEIKLRTKFLVWNTAQLTTSSSSASRPSERFRWSDPFWTDPTAVGDPYCEAPHLWIVISSRPVDRLLSPVGRLPLAGDLTGDVACFGPAPPFVSPCSTFLKLKASRVMLQSCPQWDSPRYSAPPLVMLQSCFPSSCLRSCRNICGPKERPRPWTPSTKHCLW